MSHTNIDLINLAKKSRDKVSEKSKKLEVVRRWRIKDINVVWVAMRLA
jgi:hypothetical protein